MHNCAGMTRLSPSPPSQTCGGVVNMNGISAVWFHASLGWFHFPLLISMMVFTMAAHGKTYVSLMPKRHPQVLFQFEKRRGTIFNTTEVFATCRRCLQNSHNMFRCQHVSSVNIFLDCTRPKSGPEIAWEKKLSSTGHTVAGCLLAAKFCDARARTHTHSIVTQWKQPSTHKHT